MGQARPEARHRLGGPSLPGMMSPQAGANPWPAWLYTAGPSACQSKQAALASSRGLATYQQHSKKVPVGGRVCPLDWLDYCWGEQNVMVWT